MAFTQVDISQIAANATSFAALREVVPTSEGQLARLSGHAADSNVGGGVFRAVLSEGVDDGGVIASNGGAYHWVRIFEDEVTPQMFGALADGSTDDSAALSAAIASGYGVYLPPGDYFITSTVSSSGVSVGLRGSGSQASRIVTSKDITALSIALGYKDSTSTLSDTFHVSGIGFISSVSVSSSTKPCIVIDGSAQTTSGIIGARARERGGMRDISINGDALGTGWLYGIKYISVMNHFLDGYHYAGLNRTGTGIWLSGVGMPTDMHFNNLWIFQCEKGIFAPDYLEGLHCTNFEFVQVNYGFWMGVYSEGHSVVPESEVGALACYIDNGHVYYFKGAIVTYKGNQSFYSNLLLYCAAETGTDASALAIHIQSGNANKLTNIDIQYVGTIDAGNCTGIYVDNSAYTTVSGITMAKGYAAVLLGNGSSYNSISNIICTTQTTYVVTEFPNAGTNSYNSIGPVIRDGSGTCTYHVFLPYSADDGYHNTMNYTWVPKTSVLTTSSGAGSVGVDISSYVKLSVKPAYCPVSIGNQPSHPYNAYYSYDSSSLTNMVFIASSSTGTNTLSDTIRLSYFIPTFG